MTYLSDDQGIETANPIELYKFVAPGASYFYTSHPVDVSYGGNTYVSNVLMRSNLWVNPLDEGQDLEIKFPVSTPIVQAFAFGIPEQHLLLTSYRMHSNVGVPVVAWEGTVPSFRVAGMMASCKLVSTTGRVIKQEIGTVWRQRQCNHQLGDIRCAFVITPQVAAVTSISADGRTIVVSTVGGNPDTYFPAGKMFRTADGDERTIMKQTGTSILLLSPMRALAALDAITMIPGCAGDVRTCRDKFNNVRRFSGTPHTRSESPFLQFWGFN